MEPAAGMLQVKLEPGLVKFSLLEAMQCEAQLFFIHWTITPSDPGFTIALVPLQWIWSWTRASRVVEWSSFCCSLVEYTKLLCWVLSTPLGIQERKAVLTFFFFVTFCSFCSFCFSFFSSANVSCWMTSLLQLQVTCSCCFLFPLLLQLQGPLTDAE